jgi:hypothetical protein
MSSITLMPVEHIRHPTRWRRFTHLFSYEMSLPSSATYESSAVELRYQLSACIYTISILTRAPWTRCFPSRLGPAALRLGWVGGKVIEREM